MEPSQRKKELIPLKLKKLLPIIVLALLLVWYFLPTGESAAPVQSAAPAVSQTVENVLELLTPAAL